MTMKKFLKLFEQEVPAAPAPAPGQTFSQAFAAGRKAALAGGDKTFKWRDPKTGKEGTYGTELKKPAKLAAANSELPVNNQSSSYNAQAQAPTMSDRAATDPAVAGRSTDTAKPAATPAPPGDQFSQNIALANRQPPAAGSPFNNPTVTPAATSTATTTPVATTTPAPAAEQPKPIADFSKFTAPKPAEKPQYGGGYNPSQVTYAVDQPKDDPQAVKGGFGQPTNIRTDSPDEIAKRGPMGIRLPESDLEEDNELTELMRLSGQPVQEKAPPTAKGERMVKHIKQGYAKDDKLTDKEKSIAYATAWKAHNKDKVSESVMLEAGNNLEHIVTRFKHETKNFLNGSDLDSDLYEALYDYYSDAGEIPYGIAKARDGDPYQWVGDRFESDLAMLGHQRQFQETVMPVVDNTLSELARLAGLSESRVDECGDMGMDHEDSFNVSTNMSSDGTKSVNISAQGDRADALLQMLKMAGMRPHDNDNSMGMTEPEVIMISSEPHHDEPVDEEYANSSDQEYQTVDSIIHQGNDLNREKRQYADKPKLGDNPMAEEVALDEELEALLNSVLVREEEPTWLQRQPSKSQEEIAKDWDARVKASKDYVIPAERGGIRGATNPPPDSQYPPGDKRNMMPPKRK